MAPGLGTFSVGCSPASAWHTSPDGTPTRVPSARWRQMEAPDGTPTRVGRERQIGHPPESEGARGCQIGHPPESPGGSRASQAAKEGAGRTIGQTGARGRACPWLGRTRWRRELAAPRMMRPIWRSAQAVARTQCASVVVGARWRFEATRASHDVGSCRRPGGARPFPTGASCRLPAAHSGYQMGHPPGPPDGTHKSGCPICSHHLLPKR